MTTHRTQKEIVLSAELNSEYKRLLQRARNVFEVEELNSETALLAARNVRRQLSESPQTLRLMKEHNVLALLDDLGDFRDRLREEQTDVETKIIQQSQNRHANMAYAQRRVACLGK